MCLIYFINVIIQIVSSHYDIANVWSLFMSGLLIAKLVSLSGFDF